MEVPQVHGLGAPLDFASPGSGAAVDEMDDEAQARRQRELRLMELEQELANAQHANRALREQLTEASFQQAVLARTSEAQKMFMAQTMAQTSEAERLRDAAREETVAAQRRMDQQKLMQNERQVRELQEELRVLRASFNAERSSLASDTHDLERQLLERTEEQQRMAKETAALKARLRELETEQQHLAEAEHEQSRRLKGTVQLYAPDGSALPPVSQDFFAFLAGSFKGDYLQLRHSSLVAHTLATQAQIARAKGMQAALEEDILFSDHVVKYNRRSKPQARVLLLSQTALYIFADAKSLELRRRVPLRHIDRVSLSRMCTDLFIVHNSSEQDLLLTCPKRAELMYHLQQAYAGLSASRTPLPYELGERLYVCDGDGRVRDISILDSGSFKIGKAFLPDQQIGAM